MNGCVVRRFKLMSQEPTVCFGKFLRFLIHPEAFLCPRRQHDLGAEETHQFPAFDGETVSHGYDQRIAFCRTDHSKTDAGVAAGCLNDGLSGFQIAPAFGFFNNADRQAILDRCGRIKELGLDVNADAFGRQTIDANAWGVTDRVYNGIVNLPTPVGLSGLCPSHNFLPWFMVYGVNLDMKILKYQWFSAFIIIPVSL